MTQSSTFEQFQNVQNNCVIILINFNLNVNKISSIQAMALDANKDTIVCKVKKNRIGNAPNHSVA